MYNFYDFLKFLTTDWDDYQDRLVENTKQGEYEIDTCFANDTNLYETAIKKNNGEWIVVEEYKDKQTAEKKHFEWVEFTKSNPSKAYSIQTGEYEDF